MSSTMNKFQEDEELIEILNLIMSNSWHFFESKEVEESNIKVEFKNDGTVC